VSSDFLFLILSLRKLKFIKNSVRKTSEKYVSSAQFFLLLKQNLCIFGMETAIELDFVRIDRGEDRISPYYIIIEKEHCIYIRFGSSSKLAVYRRRKLTEIFYRSCVKIDTVKTTALYLLFL
jgi:hypothetical protein